MTDRETISVYDQRADEYARKLTSDAPYPRLEAFIDALPAGGHALDLGCGPGNAAARMVARGLNVDALDASVAMVDLARQRYGLEIRVGTFDDIDGTDIFDGVWAHFSLLHAKRSKFPRHVSDINRALKPGGTLLLAMKLGAGEERDSIGRFYTYYTESDLDALMEDTGFDVVRKEYGRDTGLSGTESDWIALHARAR